MTTSIPFDFVYSFFFFTPTATPEIYTLSLHYALPISRWIAVNRCTRVAEMAIPTLPPSWRIRLKSPVPFGILRSEEHTSELQSHVNLVCRLLLEKKKKKNKDTLKEKYHHLKHRHIKT